MWCMNGMHFLSCYYLYKLIKYTVYHEIYATKNFCEFCEFYSVAKIKIAKIPQFHCHVVQFAAIRKNLFCEILELQDSQNFFVA